MARYVEFTTVDHTTPKPLYDADTGHFLSSSNNTIFAKETGDGSPKHFPHTEI